MTCDTCKKVGVRLIPLRDFYATDAVKEVCPDCEKVINDQLRKLQVVAGNIQRGLLRRFIDNLTGVAP